MNIIGDYNIYIMYMYIVYTGMASCEDFNSSQRAILEHGHYRLIVTMSDSKVISSTVLSPFFISIYILNMHTGLVQYS